MIVKEQQIEVEQAYRLTPVQEGILFHCLRRPDAGFYLEQLTVDLRGSVDVERLAAACRPLSARHPVLRTAFAWRDLREPLQLVGTAAEIPVRLLDYSGLSPAGREAATRVFLAEDRAAGFDLTCAPLLRFALVRLEENLLRLVFTNHHLILDGWSRGLLLSEIFQSYAGRAPAAPNSHFSEFIQFSRKTKWPGETEFWTRTLAGFTEPTPLPGATEAAADRNPKSRVLDRAVPGDLTGALETFARARGLSQAMVIATVWALITARATGREDIVFGMAFAGRSPALPGCEFIIGPCVNTLPFRARLRPTASVLETLHEIQAHQEGLHRYEHSALPRIQAASPVAGGSELFDMVFAYEKLPLPTLPPGADFVVEKFFSDSRSHYSLSFAYLPEANGARLQFVYDANRFAPGIVDQLARQTLRLLREVTQRPDQALDTFELAGPEEQDRELFACNHFVLEEPKSNCARLFAETALAWPDRPALTFADGSFTYAELDLASAGLARVLIDAGIEPGERVALLFERSAALVTALLAVVRAGAVYLPLDPDQPRERNVFMLEDSAARHLVVGPGLEDTIPEFAGTVLKYAAAIRPAQSHGVRGAVENRHGTAVEPNPDDPIYLMYTSGSTGRPRGILIPHRGVVRLVRDTNYIRIQATDRIGQAANVAFDAATFELWGALLNGACVVGIPRETLLDPARFGPFLREHEISILFLTTALFNLFAREQPDVFACLRVLLFGGEQGDPAAVNRVLKAGAPTTLCNVYGPTECTTFATYYPIQSPLPAGTVPIGKPIARTTAYILNERLTPVAPGFVGEIFLAGPGLALEYPGQPELTAARFVAAPAAWARRDPRLPTRLYRTGDRGRRRADGNIEFVGRVDFQLKVRGFRVEPGEIETRLRAVPGIADAVVLPGLTRDGDTRLVAHIHLKKNHSDHSEKITPGSLRAFLAATLPEAMIPAEFVHHASFPLTPTGKIDRSVLSGSGHPAHATARPAEQRNAAEDETERVVRLLFAGALGREDVPPDANFFELGGHSLIALRLLGRINESFRVDVSLQTLLSALTVRSLAATIRGLEPRADRIAAGNPSRTAGTDAVYQLSPAQEALFFLDRYAGGANHYIMSIAVRIHGPLDRTALEDALAELTRRHEILRAVFFQGPDGPAWRPGDPVCTVNPIDLSHRPDPERELELARLAAELDRTPIDILRGPPLRAGIARLNADDHALILNFHHIIADGWSLDLIAREIETLYADLRAGRPVSLPPVELQYGAYARAEGERDRTPARTDQFAYWRERLKDLPDLRLPGNADAGHDAFMVPIAIPDRIRKKIEKLGKGESTGLFAVLLAAYATALTRLTGQNDFAIGAPVARRHYQATLDAIGLYLNTVALRTAPDPELCFREIVRRTGRTVLEALAHQDVPFDRLVRMLAPPRAPGINPFFQTMFMYRNGGPPGQSFTLEGLRVSPVSFELSTARLPLELHLWEQPERLAGFLLVRRSPGDRQTARGVGDLFLDTLSRTAEFPDLRLGEIFSRRAGVRFEAAPAQVDPRIPNVPASPRLENDLRRLFADSLGIVDFQAQANFFEQGGHSLSALRLAARIQEQLATPVRVRDLFEHPTPADLARFIQNALEAGNGRADGDRPPDPVAAAQSQESNQELPPVLAQRGLWFLGKILSLPEIYNMPVLLEFAGDFREGQRVDLERALTALVRRHAALRARFVETPAGPVQVTCDPEPFKLAEPRAVAGMSEIEREARRPFDPATGPLFRANLFRLESGRTLLLLNLHHLIADGRSIEIILHDLFTPESDGVPIERAPWSRFALAERDQDFNAELRYWKRRLRHVRPLRLPADFPAPPVPSAAGGEIPFQIPASLTRELAAALMGETFSPFMLYLAAFQTLLHRIGGQTTVPVGSPVANRPAPFERTVGLFVNMIAICTNFNRNLSFREILLRVRRGVLRDLSRAHAPFDRVVAALNPDRSASENPIFQAVFAYQGKPESGLNEPDWNRTPLPAIGAKFDLELYLDESHSGLSGRFIFKTSRFRHGTIRRLARQYLFLLETIARSPDLRISDMEWPATVARGTFPGYSGREPRTIGAGFARQARRFPESPALRWNGRETTYAELDDQANRIAGSLRSRGYGPGSVGALRLNPSPLQAAHFCLTATGRASLVGVPNFEFAHLLFESDSREYTPTPVDPALPALLTADESGTGLTLTQELVSGLAVQAGIAIDLRPGDLVGGDDPLLALIALLKGACFVWTPDAPRTVSDWPPGFLFASNEIIQSIAKSTGGPGRLRCLIAREEAPYDTLRTLRARAPGLQLWQMLRPGSFPLPVLAQRIRRLSPRVMWPVRGRPLSPCSARIIDPAGHPVPPGGIGELVLDGPKGFVARTGETARIDQAGRLHRVAIDLERTPGAPQGTHGLDAELQRDFEGKLLSIWRDVLGRSRIATTDDFFELGGHSLLAVRLLGEIRRSFARELPAATLFTARTIAEQAGALRSLETAAPGLPLVRIKATGSGAPVFLVHPGGGSPLCYIPLARSLVDHPVFGFQARGIETGEIPETDVSVMAAAYIAAMKTARPAGPYHIAGWSAGGVIAFEMARQLEAAGEALGFVGLLDAGLPGGAGPGAMLISALAMIANLAQSPLRSANDLRNLLRLIGIVPPTPDAPLDLAGLFARLAGDLPRYAVVYRDIFLALHRYRPRPVRARLHLFLSEHESLPGLQHGLRENLRAFATGGLEVITIPGNHMTLLDEHNAPALAGAIQSVLDGRPVSGATVAPVRTVRPVANVPARLPATYTDRTAYLGRWFSDMNFSYALDLDGRLDEDRIRRAVRLAMDVHPVLGCRYEDDFLAPAWARREDLDHLDVCEIRYLSESKKIDEVAAFTSAPAPVESGPVMRALVARGDRDTLCLKFNHIATDARGAIQVLNTVAGLYRRLEREPGLRAFSDPTPRDWNGLGASLGANGWLRALRRFGQDARDILAHGRGDFHVPARRAEPPFDRSYAFVDFYEAEFQALQAYRRRLNVTLNEVVMAAYIRALANLIQPAPGTAHRIGMAVDLRRYLRPPPLHAVGIGNLAAFAYPCVGDDPGSSLDTTARQVARQVRGLKENMMGLGDWAAFRLLPESLLPLAGLPALVLKKTHADAVLPPLFSSMLVDKSATNFGAVRGHFARMYSHLLRPPNFLLMMTVCEQSLSLGFAYCAKSLDPTVARAFLNDLKHEALARALPGRGAHS